MIILYCLVLFALGIYSYALVDPNYTLFNSSIWNIFREKLVYLGYYQRGWSFLIYLVIVIVLFILSYFFTKNYKKFSSVKIAIFIGGILLLAYPFLSHDLFNYMFDAKILTYYHANPYLHKALDFPKDPWTRFMHWTHRPYPYGPTFLPLTLIPSFLSFGKFLLDFLLFKILFTSFYISTVYLLQKQNRQWAMFFATNPLIIIEGIVNAHNDIVAVTLALIGTYFLMKDNKIIARVIFILSGGIKYITAPFIFMSQRSKSQNYLVVGAILVLLLILCFIQEVQAWYFLTLFIFLPYYDKVIMKLQIFFAGLLFSYYPFIALGEWNVEKLNIKHIIIIVFLTVNIIYIIIERMQRFSFKKNK